MNKTPMTLQGAEDLRNELQTRKTKDRGRITNLIAEARAHGDLKENAEYHAAREQQSFNEGRIAELEGKLANAEIIDVQKLQVGKTIVFGATVTLLNIETSEEVTYLIVGEDEADIKLGKVSINSPIARALIGNSEGDDATVNAPGGEVEYEIVSVQYG